MLLTEIAQYLHNQGIVMFDETGVSGDCFISVLPSSPDSVVAIFPSGGDGSDVKLGYDSPTVQVIVRGTQDPRPTLSRAQDIYNALHGFHSDSFIVNGLYVVSCQGIQSGPTHIGRDENGRHENSLNFELEIRNQSTHRE